MTGYEFMGNHPFLTIILALIGGMTLTECVKYMFIGIRGQVNESEEK